MVTFGEKEAGRVKKNLEAGRQADFVGEGKCYVGNLAFECDEEALSNRFAEFGEVGEVSIVRDDTGRSRGFAFVTMVEREDGDKVIAALNGQDMLGRDMQIRPPN